MAFSPSFSSLYWEGGHLALLKLKLKINILSLCSQPAGAGVHRKQKAQGGNMGIAPVIAINKKRPQQLNPWTR